MAHVQNVAVVRVEPGDITTWGQPSDLPGNEHIGGIKVAGVTVHFTATTRAELGEQFIALGSALNSAGYELLLTEEVAS